MDILLAVIIFIVSYIFIMTEKVNRAIIALAGGVLMTVTGIFTINDAFTTYIDWDTITLLFSMMVLISITEKTGLFSFIAIYFVQKVKGNPIALLIGTGILTAVGSAFLDNVTTVLIFVPILLQITRLLKLPPFPFLLMVIFSSNIGGAATLIGDPPNIMIGQAVDHFTFLSFLQHMGPLAIGLFFAVAFLLWLIFYQSFRQLRPETEQMMMLHAMEKLIISPALFYSIAVLLLTMTGFILHAFLPVSITMIALSAAILLLLLTEKEFKTEKILSNVEWITIFFFIGLFALVGGLEEAGVIDIIARFLLDLTNGNYAATTLLVLWMAGIFSGFIDNIPFVATMIPVISEFHHYGIEYLDPIWWALAIGACFGGNMTLIGASANLVVAGISESAGEKIAFLRFIKYGVPITIFSLIISTIYVYIRYL